MLIKYIIIITFILLFNSFIFKLNKDVVEGFAVYDFIDSRVFYLDENQKGKDLRDLLQNLHKTNCIGWKISGFPYLRTYNKLVPYFNTDKILGQYVEKMEKKYKHQIFPFICCIENSKKGYAHVKNMLKDYPNLWKGIGPIYLKNNAVYNDAELQKYIPDFKLDETKKSLISSSLSTFVNEGEQPRNYNNIMDLDETYMTHILKLAKDNKLIINIDYYFDNIQDDTPDLLKGILNESDELESNYKLYEGDYKLLRFLNTNKDAKIVLRTNVFKKRTFKINNRLKQMDILEYYDMLLKNYPNVVIELSGETLLNCFITESKTVEKIDNNMGFEERKAMAGSGLNQVRSFGDLANLILGPIDRFFSGKPLTEEEKEMPIRKSVYKNPLTPIDFKKINKNLDTLGKAFDKDDDADNKNARDEIKMAELDKKLTNDILNKFENDELEKAQKGVYEPEIDPNVSYDTDGNPMKPLCPNPIPPYLLSNAEFIKNLYCTPKVDMNFNNKLFIASQIGSSAGNLFNEMGSGEPSGKKLKKYAKKMSKKKNKIPQLTKLVKIEKFENYNVNEMFGNLDDVGFKITRKGLDTAKGYAQESVRLPNNTPPPNNSPVSDAEANATTIRDYQKGVKSRDLINVVKKTKNYGKDGPKVVNDIKEAGKTVTDNIVNEKNNKSILERPKDIYNLGFVQYIEPKTRRRYYYLYGPPEYEYIDEKYIIYNKKVRKIEDIDETTAMTEEELDELIEKKGIEYYGIKEKLESGNLDDLPIDSKKDIINYIKTKKQAAESDRYGDTLYFAEQNTINPKQKAKLNKLRMKEINSNLDKALETPSDKNVIVNETIHKYSYHDAKIKKEWIRLLEKYSNNFVLGTGVKIDFEHYPSNCVLVNRILSELDENKAIKIGRTNFLQLLD
jgi:hypothetical protein